MKISRFVYGFLIIGILLGGLFVTNLAGIWEVNRRGAEQGLPFSGGNSEPTSYNEEINDNHEDIEDILEVQ